MLSGAILAGGTSSRMGQEKGLALLRNKPLISYVAKTISMVADEVVVAVAPGMSGLYTEVLGEEFRVYEDCREHGGPLDGLITALAAAKGEYVIVCPCDTPFLRPELMESIARFAKGRDGAIPIVRGYIEPLHGAFRRSHCLSVFEEAVEEGYRKVADAFAMLNLVMIDEDIVRGLDMSLESFWNLNTPEDLAQAEHVMACRLD